MDDWKVGDLALCVTDYGYIPDGYEERAAVQCSPVISMLFPRVGSEWNVVGVEIHWLENEGGRDFIYLKLAGQPSDYVYDARYFRKILPLSDEERDGFLADLDADTRIPVVTP